MRFFFGSKIERVVVAASEITPAIIRFSAMSLLALREHSVHELRHKLLQKFIDLDGFGSTDSSHLQESIAVVIKNLSTDGLQSDARFTEAFITMRQRQGKGPLIVRMELRERGIDSEMILNSISVCDPVWNQIAKKVFVKKFGDPAANNIKQVSKQTRFLVSRGFSAANIQHVLNAAAQAFE